MSITTGRGDGGETDLWRAGRVDKDHPRIEVCGQLDELAAALGYARSQLPESLASLSADLGRVQDDLFAAGAVVATPGKDPRSGWGNGKAALAFAEERIHDLESRLPPLKTFIRPAGPPTAAALHQARAVCRRAERRLVTARREETIDGSILVFLNRLSDLIFLWAREVHRASGAAEEPWEPRAE